MDGSHATPLRTTSSVATAPPTWAAAMATTGLGRLPPATTRCEAISVRYGSGVCTGVDLTLDPLETPVQRRHGPSGDTSGAADTPPRYPPAPGPSPGPTPRGSGAGEAAGYSRPAGPRTSRRPPPSDAERSTPVAQVLEELDMTTPRPAWAACSCRCWRFRSPWPAGSAGAAPPTVPPGYVQLVDDTGVITVVVPDTGPTSTAPLVSADGTPQAHIAAAPDRQEFDETFNVPARLFVAVPYQADPQVLIDELELPSGCAQLDVTPTTTACSTGLAQVGAVRCRRSLVGDGRGQPCRPVLHRVRPGAGGDGCRRAALGWSCSRSTGQHRQAPGSAPTASTTRVRASRSQRAAGLGPVEVATMFLDSLAAGDGATACALLAEEMTINFVEEAETCALELSLQVLGQGEFWASVQIEGDDDVVAGPVRRGGPADDYVSLELQGPTDDGCLSISIDNGEWRIEDLSNSIWNQAS